MPPAVSSPMIWLALVSRIWFSAICPAVCSNTTAVSAPMLKVSQRISARAWSWVTVMVVPSDVMPPMPVTTLGPVGSAPGATWAPAPPAASIRASASRVGSCGRRRGELPRPPPRCEASSEATCITPSARLNTMR